VASLLLPDMEENNDKRRREDSRDDRDAKKPKGEGGSSSSSSSSGAPKDAAKKVECFKSLGDHSVRVCPKASKEEKERTIQDWNGLKESLPTMHWCVLWLQKVQ
jgi:hypothetical protein